MWNCLGTYYQAILESNGYNNEWLNIFKGYSIRYKRTNRDELFSKYGNNPWGYQPIEFFKKDQIINFEYLIEQFFKDMNIKVEKKRYSNDLKLDIIIRECLRNEIYLIINVDEFYLEHLKKYFFKIHNKHFLLIYGMKGKIVTVVDSEIGTCIDIPIDQIKRSIERSSYRNMMIYYVHLPEYKNKYTITYDSYKELNRCLANINWKKDVFKGIYTGINNKYSNYYLEGFCFMISFKILPYLRWLCLLNSRCEYPDKFDIDHRLTDEIRLWETLILILEIEIRKHSANIINKIEIVKNKIMLNASILTKGEDI